LAELAEAPSHRGSAALTSRMCSPSLISEVLFSATRRLGPGFAALKPLDQHAWIRVHGVELGKAPAPPGARWRASIQAIAQGIDIE